MPGEMGALDALAVEELPDGAHQRVDLALADLLDRAAVAGEIQREDRALRGERLGVEHPVVQVAAEAVEQHERHAALAVADEAQRTGPDRDGLGLRAGVLLGLTGDEAGLEV